MKQLVNRVRLERHFRRLIRPAGFLKSSLAVVLLSAGALAGAAALSAPAANAAGIGVGGPGRPPGSGGPPSTPSCATTATGGTGEITVNWCPPVNNGSQAVNCYQIYRSSPSSPATEIAEVCIGSPEFASTTYTDTSVTCNTTYSYYEISSNIFGTSAPSNSASASAACGSPPPPIPEACTSYTGNSAFVCVLYEDILGRAPDSGGLNSWLAALSSGTTRTQVAFGIVDSLESGTDYLNYLYQGCLGRPVDSGGLATWIAAFEAGATVEQVDAGVLGSAEFYTYTGSTPSGFIDGVYECLLGRSADPSGLSTWSAALANGVSRSQVVYDVDTSNEAFNDDVQSDYQSLLGRSADPAGLATWVGALSSGVTDLQVFADIAGSQEFYDDATGA